MSLSVAIQPPSAIYREEQRFGWWVYVLLAAALGLGWWLVMAPDPVGVPAAARHGRELTLALFTGSGLLVLLGLGTLRMTTVVTPIEVRVWFGWIPTYRRALPTGSIARVEVAQFRPIADYGGWGVLHGRDGERALTARGDRGVRLHMLDGSRILIGSQRPEELALAVEGALRPGI